LGSKSPRRKDLMTGMGIDFSLRIKDTDESYPPSLPPKKVPLYIAHKKTDALREDLKEDELLLCADTVVILENRIIEKPTTEQEAIEMLRLLSGKTHEVITGVVIASLEKTESFSTSTKVTFQDLSEEEIIYYVQNYQPLDKAGAYGIQEWIGYVGVTSIEGSFFNVMGLPTQEVFQALKDF
jgi:septum formation protein